MIESPRKALHGGHFEPDIDTDQLSFDLEARAREFGKP